MVEEISLKDAIKAKDAERILYREIRKIAEDMGQNADLEVDNYREDGNLVILWGGGPERWAYRLLNDGIGPKTYKVVDKDESEYYDVEVKSVDEIVITKL